MAVFVVLALALAVMAIGMVVVGIVVLRRQVQALTQAVDATMAQVRELTTELSEESAVLALEAEALQRRLADGTDKPHAGYTAKSTRAPADGS